MRPNVREYLREHSSQLVHLIKYCSHTSWPFPFFVNQNGGSSPSFSLVVSSLHPHQVIHMYERPYGLSLPMELKHFFLYRVLRARSEASRNIPKLSFYLSSMATSPFPRPSCFSSSLNAQAAVLSSPTTQDEQQPRHDKIKYRKE